MQHFGKLAPRYSMAGTKPGGAGASREWRRRRAGFGITLAWRLVSENFSRGTIMLLAIVGPAVLLCERYILARYIAYEAQYGKLHRRRRQRPGAGDAIASSERSILLSFLDNRTLVIVCGSNIEEIHVAVRQ